MVDSFCEKDSVSSTVSSWFEGGDKDISCGTIPLSRSREGASEKTVGISIIA